MNVSSIALANGWTRATRKPFYNIAIYWETKDVNEEMKKAKCDNYYYSKVHRHLITIFLNYATKQFDTVDLDISSDTPFFLKFDKLHQTIMSSLLVLYCF